MKNIENYPKENGSTIFLSPMLATCQMRKAMRDFCVTVYSRDFFSIFIFAESIFASDPIEIVAGRNRVAPFLF